MRSAELLVYGVEDALGRWLAAWALDHALWHRSISNPTSLVNLLRKGSDGVLVLRLGRDVLAELELLHAAKDAGLRAIVVSDPDYPALEGIAYDLGADAVVFPADGFEPLVAMLTAIATGLGKR